MKSCSHIKKAVEEMNSQGVRIESVGCDETTEIYCQNCQTNCYLVNDTDTALMRFTTKAENA